MLVAGGRWQSLEALTRSTRGLLVERMLARFGHGCLPLEERQPVVARKPQWKWVALKHNAIKKKSKVAFLMQTIDCSLR